MELVRWVLSWVWLQSLSVCSGSYLNFFRDVKVGPVDLVILMDRSVLQEDSQTDRHTDTQTHTHTHTHTQRQAHRHTDKHTNSQTDTQMNTQTN